MSLCTFTESDDQFLLCDEYGSVHDVWVGQLVPRTLVTSNNVRGFRMVQDCVNGTNRTFPVFIMTDLTSAAKRERVRTKYGYTNCQVEDATQGVLYFTMALPNNISKHERALLDIHQPCPIFMCHTEPGQEPCVLLVAVGIVECVEALHITVAVPRGFEHPIVHELL